jgi:hypothetical protein
MDLATQECLSFPPRALACSNGISHLRIMKHNAADPLLPKSINIKTYRTVTSPVVLYGCETWSIVLREEHKMKVFINSMLVKMLGHKMENVTMAKITH